MTILVDFEQYSSEKTRNVRSNIVPRYGNIPAPFFALKREREPGLEARRRRLRRIFVWRLCMSLIGIIKVRKISRYREIEGNVQVLSHAARWCTEYS